MNMRKLADTLLVIGGAGLALALMWWATFYSEVGIGGREAIGCLWSRAGPCGFVSGLAQMSGKIPYSPVVFWIGAGALLSGIIVRSTITQEHGKSEAEQASRTLPLRIIPPGAGDYQSFSQTIQASYWPSGTHVGVGGHLSLTTTRLTFVPDKGLLKKLSGREPSAVEIPLEQILSIHETSRGSLQSLIQLNVRSRGEYRFILLKRDKNLLFESLPSETGAVPKNIGLYCPRCGEQSEKADKFCASCGAQLRAGA